VIWLDHDMGGKGVPKKPRGGGKKKPYLYMLHGEQGDGRFIGGVVMTTIMIFIQDVISAVAKQS